MSAAISSRRKPNSSRTTAARTSTDSSHAPIRRPAVRVPPLVERHPWLIPSTPDCGPPVGSLPLADPELSTIALTSAASSARTTVRSIAAHPSPPSARPRTRRPRAAASSHGRARPGVGRRLDPHAELGRRPPDPRAGPRQPSPSTRPWTTISVALVVRCGTQHDPTVSVDHKLIGHDLTTAECIGVRLRPPRHLRQEARPDLENLRGCEPREPDQTGQSHTAGRRRIGRPPLVSIDQAGRRPRLGSAPLGCRLDIRSVIARPPAQPARPGRPP